MNVGQFFETLDEIEIARWKAVADVACRAERGDKTLNAKDIAAAAVGFTVAEVRSIAKYEIDRQPLRAALAETKKLEALPETRETREALNCAPHRQVRDKLHAGYRGPLKAQYDTARAELIRVANESGYDTEGVATAALAEKVKTLQARMTEA